MHAQQLLSKDTINVCATLVEVFVDWLYTRKLPSTNQEWVDKEHQPDQHVQWHTAVQLTMIKAYAFADRMLSPDLCRALERTLIDHFIVTNHTPYYGAVIYAFANLPSTSSVLRAMMDAHCRDFEETGDTEENGEMKLRAQLPNTFLVGVMVRYAKLKAKKVTRLDRCSYHDHATEHEKEECQKAAPTPAGDKHNADDSQSRSAHLHAISYGVNGLSDDSSSSNSDSSTENDSDSDFSDSDNNDSD